MTLISDIKNRILPVILGFAFVIFGIGLFVNSLSTKNFSEELLIYDLIWMDAWSLAFLGILIAFWSSKLGRNQKVIFCIGLLSIYLVVVTSLILNGTPFYLFGFWGDQSFRQAMILKFAAITRPTDYYYKDLPPFYPPLYYYLQAIFARVFSVEAYKMSKIGQMLIFAVLPLVHFYFWRRLVAPVQAGFITLLAFLYSNYAGALQFFSPHSFIAYALFIPWWLFYIERVTKPATSVKFYIVGGIIGALLFATYFYAFFIGAVSLLLKLAYERIPLIKKKVGGFTLMGALKVLIASAVLSSPYWLPVLISIISSGLDRSRGGWYHIGYPGLDIQFVKFTIEGIALLAGTIFIFRRIKKSLNFALANFVLTILFFHFVGSILGALDYPVNLAKSTDLFTMQLAAPIIGLCLAAFARRDMMSRKRIGVTPILTGALLLVLFNNLSGIAKSDATKKARTAIVPTWNTDFEEMQSRKGSVFLNGQFEFQSFYPVYSFLTLNELYSHPASRYFERYKFLYYLQSIKDPSLFHLTLQHNKFDKVDFFMPLNIDGKFGLRAAFSNYPNKGFIKDLKFERDCVKDTALFSKRTGDNLYEIKPLRAGESYRPLANRFLSKADSMLQMAHVREITKYLEPDGKSLITGLTGLDWSNWQNILANDTGVQFSDSLNLSEIWAADCGDSLYFIYKFACRQDISGSYKVFLHLKDAVGGKHNFDFVPRPATDSWKKWDFIILVKGVPKKWNQLRISTGFHLKGMVLGETTNLEWKSTN